MREKKSWKHHKYDFRQRNFPSFLLSFSQLVLHLEITASAVPLVVHLRKEWEKHCRCKFMHIINEKALSLLLLIHALSEIHIQFQSYFHTSFSWDHFHNLLFFLKKEIKLSIVYCLLKKTLKLKKNSHSLEFAWKKS